jgi:hypothetical protein
VSTLSIANGIFEVKSTVGEAFDNNMVEHLSISDEAVVYGDTRRAPSWTASATTPPARCC